MKVLKLSPENFFLILAMLFVASLIIADIIGGTVIEIAAPNAWYLGAIASGGVVRLSAGIIPFPMTFLLTDLINEFYGTRGARKVTFLGLGAAIFVFFILFIIRPLPIAADSPISTEAFHTVFGMSQRIFIASLTAYVIGQLLDIAVFFSLRKLTDGKHLWLRATGSTVVSQLVDSIIVTSIAFYDKLPWNDIMHIGLGNYSVKFLIAVGLTPFCYLGHSIIKNLLDRDLEDKQHHLLAQNN